MTFTQSSKQVYKYFHVFIHSIEAEKHEIEMFFFSHIYIQDTQL